MLQDVYNHNPIVTNITAFGLSILGAILIGSGMIAKKRSKTLISLGLISGISAHLIVIWNRPIGIAGKNPEDVINWLKLEGFTNIPEEEIRKTGHYFWR